MLAAAYGNCCGAMVCRPDMVVADAAKHLVLTAVQGNISVGGMGFRVDMVVADATKHLVLAAVQGNISVGGVGFGVAVEAY